MTKLLVTPKNIYETAHMRIVFKEPIFEKVLNFPRKERRRVRKLIVLQRIEKYSSKEIISKKDSSIGVNRIYRINSQLPIELRIVRRSKRTEKT